MDEKEGTALDMHHIAINLSFCVHISIRYFIYLFEAVLDTEECTCPIVISVCSKMFVGYSKATVILKTYRSIVPMKRNQNSDRETEVSLVSWPNSLFV